MKRPFTLRHGLGAIILMTAMASLVFASSAFAEANAVIPTSAAPGVSETEINNYVEVPFARNDDGTWPCGGAGNAPPPCPGPEGQTGPEAYPMGFGINFFGTKYSAAFINNNGNITFTEPLAQFTPSSLTTFGSPIIAPFFADVDTRNAASAIANFGKGTLNGKKVFVVNWPKVGCYNEIGSVLNNFQLILIDRPDLGTGPNGDDFNIEFNYNSIQWDTGQASGGNPACVKEGTGGTSAIAGYTNGSTNHFQLAGSEEPNAFLDSTLTTGLIYHDLNSTTLGRYLFTVENGEPPATTTLTTTLSGEGKSGESIEVKEGTAVTDNSTLAGEKASKATGTVAYKVYSDKECKTLVAEAGTASVSGGVVGPSSPETLAPGTYYWQASYSGDEHNNPSMSTCGSEVETVSSPGCAISDVKASPFTDVTTGNPVYAEDNLASTITPISPGNSAPEHLVVRGNGRFFALTGLTDVLCHDNTEYPLDAGNKFNTVSGDGPGTLGTAFGNGKPGYTAHWELSDRGDQSSGGDTGGDTINLIVYNSKGVVVWHVNGKFTTASQEETG
jgi:Nidogen-like